MENAMTTTSSPNLELDGAYDPATRLKLTMAWLFVGIPLAWGVYQVVVKALALFRE